MTRFKELCMDTARPGSELGRFWDVYGDVGTVVALGAKVLAKQPRWTVLADPEGNEFCVFP